MRIGYGVPKCHGVTEYHNEERRAERESRACTSTPSTLHSLSPSPSSTPSSATV
jgi:hypothetical protein